MVILASTKDPLPALLACAAIFIVGLAPIWLLREKPVRQKTANAAWFWFRRSIANDRVSDYEPRRRRRRRKDDDGNQLPTVESVRDLAGGNHTWVPSASRGKSDG